MASTLRLPPLLGPSVSSSVRPHDRPADFALRLCLRCWLAPLASAQPSCCLPAPALDSRLAPFVSCPCLRPAFWPASLRRSGSRPCAFVLKRPCGMPLTCRNRLLAPAAPSGPRPVSGARAPFPGSSGIGLRLVPPLTVPALRPSPLAAANSLRPADHRALDPQWAYALRNPPCRRFPPAFGLRLPPFWNRPSDPASASPLC